MNLDIKSTAFGEGDLIPKQYTCDGLVFHHNCHGHSHRKEQVAWC